MRKHVTVKSDNNSRVKFAVSIILIILGIIFMKHLQSSLFFQKKGRLNLLFYGQNPRIYSVGFDDEVNYYLEYEPDLEVNVPGCYGNYRVGAMGKLSFYEKKQDIIKRTFSSMTSQFIDIYFLSSKSEEVYYGEEKHSSLVQPSFNEIFSSKSNAGLLDKIYIYYTLLQIPSHKYTSIDYPVNTDKNKKRVLLEKKFSQQYKGTFFNPFLREDKKNIQILYQHSYSTADALGRVIEGEGARVADISESDKETKKCVITEDSYTHSLTAKILSSYLNCDLRTGKTDIYDIIVLLGPVEKEWEICN